MNILIALICTLIIGLFMLIGSLIVLLTKNNDSFVNFAISMSFSILIFLLAIDLIPEIYQLVGGFGIGSLFLIFLVLTGGFILHYLDRFIPHHRDDHCHDDHAEESHLYHIGLVTIIAIVIHNIIEGMAVYGAISSSMQSGFLISLGISLHNIPLGMAVTSTIFKANHSPKKTMFYIFLMSFSTFAGGLLMLPLGLTAYGDLILTVLLGLTIGMILYIVIYELLPTVLEKRDHKATWYGIITGIVIMLLSFLVS